MSKLKKAFVIFLISVIVVTTVPKHEASASSGSTFNGILAGVGLSVAAEGGVVLLITARGARDWGFTALMIRRGAWICLGVGVVSAVVAGIIYLAGEKADGAVLAPVFDEKFYLIKEDSDSKMTGKNGRLAQFYTQLFSNSQDKLENFDKQLSEFKDFLHPDYFLFRLYANHILQEKFGMDRSNEIEAIGTEFDLLDDAGVISTMKTALNSPDLVNQLISKDNVVAYCLSPKTGALTYLKAAAK